MPQNKTIVIAAAIITNENNEMLLVRKQNSLFFMQAGGKLEKNETPQMALLRELQEELQLTILSDQLNYLGKYCAPAANEKNYQIEAYLFSLKITGKILLPNAELAEVGWYSVEQAEKLSLAPLTKNTILPIVAKMKD